MMDKIMGMMGRRGAGAGRGFVNPPTVGEMDEKKRMMMEEAEATPEEVRERKMRKRQGEAYDASLTTMKKGGAVSASRRADGIAQRGKTKGRMI